MELLNRPAVSFIVKLFFALMLLDIGNRVLLDTPTQQKESSPSESTVSSTEAEVPKAVSESLSPDDDVVLFLYCGCCSGTKNKFDDLKELLTPEFPQLTFIGQVYPMKSSSKLLSNLIYAFQIGMSILMIGGNWIFGKLGIVPPPIYHKLVKYKMFIMFGIFFLCNHLRSIVINTNAFEVYFNEQLLFSKMATGDYPTYDVLHALIKEQTGLL